MSKPFKLNSAFKPSGDQPEAIRRLEEGLEDFGVIAAGFPLQNGGDALDAHAGIDVFLFQGQEFSVRGFIVLHEDVVPDFDPAFVLGIEDFRHRQRTGPVEHFRVGTAGTGLSGGAPPVVLLGEFRNAFVADAERTPEIVRLFIERGVFIAGEDGEGKAVNGDVQPLLATAQAR